MDEEAGRRVSDIDTKTTEMLRSYRARLPMIMAGLADRPKAGAKADAREALREHMREMHDLAAAFGRADSKPILGSWASVGEGNVDEGETRR